MTDTDPVDSAVEHAGTVHVRQTTLAWLIGQRSPHTRRAYARVLRVWARWCDQHHVDPVNPDRAHVQTWLADMARNNAAPATIRQAHAALRSWHDELTIVGCRPAIDVHRGIRLPRVPDVAAHRLLDDREVRHILDTARPLDTPAETCVAVMAAMGLRAGETGVIHAGMISRAPGGGWTLTTTGKGARGSVIPIPPVVLDAADRHGWPADGVTGTVRVSWSDEAAYRRVLRWTRRAAFDAGVTDYHPHMLRTWFISRALQMGVPADVVQMSARHASFDTTRIYARALDQTARHATHTVATLLNDDRPGIATS